MTRVILKRGDGPETWRSFGETAVVTCKCGNSHRLDHEIDDFGRVSPSLICPADCGWHVWATLEGWGPL